MMNFYGASITERHSGSVIQVKRNDNFVERVNNFLIIKRDIVAYNNKIH